MAWHYQTNGNIVGPLSTQQLKQAAAEGHITNETRVRKDNGNWVPAVKVAGLLVPVAVALPAEDWATPPPLVEEPVLAEMAPPEPVYDEVVGIQLPRPSRLVPCPDCDHQVSKKAHTCPNCGLPFRETDKRMTVTKFGMSPSAFPGILSLLGFAAATFVIFGFSTAVNGVNNLGLIADKIVLTLYALGIMLWGTQIAMKGQAWQSTVSRNKSHLD
jgi:hypothetical protein